MTYARAFLWIPLLVLLPVHAGAQQPPLLSPPSAVDYVPIETHERIAWITDGVVGARTFGVGVFASAFDTAVNTPKEWHRSWSGFGKRFLEREADVAISNSIEAGVGALWGEDPRYLRSHRHGVWPRVRYAIATAFLAPRRDGHFAPAWGRVAGNVVNNVIENTWLPPSVTTPEQTTLRSVNGFAGRIAGDLWEEFSPDLGRVLHKH